jgi:hypothetical protein
VAPAGTRPPAGCGLELQRGKHAGRRHEHAASKRRRRWWIDVAVVAVVFFAVHAFFSRGILRGPLPPLQGALADGTAITAAQ